MAKRKAKTKRKRRMRDLASAANAHVDRLLAQAPDGKLVVKVVFPVRDGGM